MYYPVFLLVENIGYLNWEVCIMDEKLKVLVVDDDMQVLNMLGRIIESEGWKCLKAPTGEIALDTLKLNEVDIVVLDLKLPRMDGFEVLKSMKELKPAVPVVILTGMGSDKEHIDMALKLGASGYVSKAMPVKQTISAIRNILIQKK